MDMYGKLNGQSITYAPKTITKNGVYYNPYPVDMMIEDGYKKIVFTPQPSETRDGYYWDSAWTETESEIVREWKEELIHVDPPVPTDMDRLKAQILYTAMMTDTLISGGEDNV